ncbi:GntR family transcriptional regulator [Virgibacillus dokdonensis]|nr:GntR family transcriptional regulator [Virgibacillus dokdonensis]
MNALYPEQWLHNLSTGEKIAAEVRMQIISKTIGSDTIISENKLAKQFDTSRSPVREALKILASEGFIQLEKMGAVILDFSDKDIEELYDIRKIMEQFVLERIIQLDTDALEQQLIKIIDMMSIAVKFKDAESLTVQDLDFHETIIRFINHKRILLMWSKMRPTMESFILLSMRRRFKDAPKDADRIVQNHKLMLKSIQDKDKVSISKAVENNFNTHHMLEKERKHHH